MPATKNVQAAAQNTKETSDQLSRQPNKAVNVYIRLMFVRIGEIDTLNEKYQAQASIEARWPIEVNKLPADLSSDDQKSLADGKSITLVKYNESHWHPQLFIENAIGELKEQIRYSARKSKDDNEIYVCEHRDIKGSFWEKLELQHFPSDVQDLSISVATMLYDEQVALSADPYYSSEVNREAFVDQQEWLLYEHTDSEQRFVKEFVFRSHDDDNHNLAGNKTKNQQRRRPVLTVTCHAARRSNYFYWNGYCLIFLITLMSFCIFAIPAHFTANRIQTSCTLLLTSITFRWTVNRSLPTISYLTSMDIYAIMCIFSLIALSIWHAVMGVFIFAWTPDFRLTPQMWLAYVDRCFFVIAFSGFVLIHIALLAWLYFVPLKHRRQMALKDSIYHEPMSDEKQNSKYTPITL